ncbi:MAG: hypothetical protein BRD55_01275 [Bacteroidetes bacterium SW_9_63_38]|nr:MAG: hypothetical protein BRD55_01275 [Bacteroidetes bacterium SW_9_63_38]
MTGAWTQEGPRLLLFVILLGFGVAAPPTRAQDASTEAGAISGVVVDKNNGESLPGANVSIEGTTTGTTTDLKGRYRLKDLDPGTYKVLFSFVGFQDKTVSGVTVKPGETTTLDVTLAEETAQMEEVVVQAQAARDTEAGMLKDRAKAASVSNAISAEAMSAAGAGTAASAMKQVTGASVVEGKYVVVRGLGGRYSKTLLNGVDLPSADPDGQSTPLDLFPSSLLSNVKTVKTFTPDQPGDFSGGLVDVTTKSFPKEFTFSASASTTINPRVQFEDGFINHSSGNVNFLGFSDNGLSIPSSVGQMSRNEFNSSRNQLTEAFGGEMGPQSGSPPVNQGYSVSLGNQSEVGGRPLGYVVAATLDRKASFYENGSTGRFERGSGGGLQPIIDLQDRKSTIESSLGGIANLTYKLTPNHEFGLNALYTHKGETVTRFQQGAWPGEASRDDVLRNRSLFFKERDVLSLNLNGESLLKDAADIKVKWNAAYSTTSQQEPDRRFFASIDREGFSPDAFDQGLREPSRLFRDLSEDQYSGKLDVTVPVTVFDRDSEIKVGGSVEYANRDFSERFFSYRRPDSEAQINFTGDEDSFFSDENFGVVGTEDASGNDIVGLTLADETPNTSSYTGERTIGAGYVMADVPVTEKLRAIGGIRLETTDLSVEASSNDQGSITEVDLLPSLNLVYSLTENMNLRAAASRTLARPTFREIAPYSSFAFIQGTINTGNPDLQRTLISNLDLRWEWFPNPGEVLAASAYYKEMDDPIEKAFISTSSNTGSQATWKNVPSATVFGAEFEARARLDRLSGTLRNFTVGGNLSLTRSEIDVPCVEFAEDDPDDCVQGELFFRQVNNEPSTRDLQGQSPFLVSLNLQYNNPESGTTASLFYSVFGERLSVVSSGSTPDVFTQPRPELTASVSQSLLDHWKIEVEAENLLDSKAEETYSFRGEEVAYQRHSLGRSFKLGLSYSIN